MREDNLTPVSIVQHSPYAIRLEFFSGPMDLLLHLVSQQEVPIEQVKMSEIAEQYLAVISSNAETVDLEAATEYLVIAATLMAIKSRSLLPSERATAEEESEEDTWESNRFFEELRDRLKAYEVTKQRASLLMSTPQLGFDTFRREDRKALLPTAEMLAEPEEVHSFALLFARLLKRIGGTASSFRISLEPISVVSSMMSLIDLLGGNGTSGLLSQTSNSSNRPHGFKSLLTRLLPARLIERIKDSSTKAEALAEARGVMIGSFIASLELIKRGVLSSTVHRTSSQDSSGDGFMVEEFSLELALDPATDPFEAETFVSEFDEVTSESDNEAEEIDERRNVVEISKYRANTERQKYEEKATVSSEDHLEQSERIRANEKEGGGV
jgi:segregation and condensation protein A